MGDLKGKKLIITSGGCEEAVDRVRCLSNFSSGRTGAALAEEALKKGAAVTLLASRRAHVPPDRKGLTLCRYTGYEDLKNALFSHLATKPDGLIMAAAVSDFSVEKIVLKDRTIQPGEGKIPSGDAPILLLKRNDKLINRVKKLYPSLKTVAFKLTCREEEDQRKEAVQSLFVQSGVDYVLANDLHEIHGETHRFRLISREGSVTEGETKQALAQSIIRLWGGPN
ncbi:MAG: phosphopantothenoylcysteine decarboxylase [Spirochaetales bacterium]|nr:phosphopantothenoylcysteine decarboxylase [Spirochaetales bacterium]